MDEDMINDIEDTVEDLPEEATDFIFGEEFEAVSQELSSLLTDEGQKKDLPNEIMLFLFGTRAAAELATYIDKLTTSDENKQKIKTIIDEKIINELVLAVEANKEIDAEAAKNTPPAEGAVSTSAPTPLASLADRLKQASIATPAKRDDLNKESVPSAGGEAAASAAKPAIDPYHEAIE